MSGISGIGAASGVHDIMALRQQIIDRNQLLQQVRTGDTASGSAPGAATTEASGSSFTGALKSALDTVNQTQTHAEAVTGAYETGQVTDIAQVMLARQQSSVAFEATLQVRNKLLSAYQDIMKLGV
ncbi:flagellar hook-basal body complex protein FliE [Novosphingobium sp. Fuku2-ISO-50]|uniref:flagellar hook-basal body complex protein FliE n=1 Tax=Novosphingobium sp. Fuku2-ISO-50 TaxID=1739114 RepID=UPI00076D151B|nr:flagellar hook-basal body complex protein FliE [Novosphingobium sp. Fuku2-ISO-50]KUR74401.1 flagellar hook-basal body protein FliE [Novosphingobium sp. Fuku2-ISO-50]